MGFVQDSIVIADGANLAIAGVQPAGIAVNGEVIWQAAAWTLLVDSVTVAPATTSAPMNTTGVNLLVAVGILGSSTFGISDSLGNVWTTGAGPVGGLYGISVISYCINPVTGSSHTFSRSANTAASFIILGFRCASGTVKVDQSNAAAVSSTPYQLPITPSANDSLVIAGIAPYSTNVNSIDSGFSIAGNVPYVYQVSVGGAAAYLAQSTAALLQPTWTIASASAAAGMTLLSFKPIPWKLLASTLFTLATSSTSGTSAPINTTGAKLIVVMNSTYAPVNAALSDSLTNTWTQTPYVVARSNLQMWYCIAPTTGTAHTFTFSSGNFSNAIIMAFSCSQNVAFDQITTATASTDVPTLQLPALTPPAANSLLIAGIANGANITSIDSNFIIAKNGPITYGVNFAVAAAYQIQETPASIAPTWQVVTPNSFPGMSAALLSFRPVPPWQLLASTQTIYPTLTSAAMDTTGANLLVVVCIRAGSGTSSIVTDSLNNIWTLGVNVSTTGGSAIYYSINPNVGSSHTFTVNQGGYGSFIVLKFAGPTAAIDGTSIAAGTALNLQMNPLTPTANNSLIVAGVMANSTIVSIDSNFTIRESVPYVSGNNYGGAAAFLVQNQISPLSPTWTQTVASSIAGTMLSLKPVPPPQWQLLASVYTVGTAPPIPATPAINTTGANLLVVVLGQFSTNNLTDSQGNIWTAGVNLSLSGSTYSTIYYCINPLTSSSHTFSISGQYSCFFVYAFKGPTSIVVDQSNTVSDSGQPSSLTLNPINASASSLVISGVVYVNISPTASIDSGFTSALLPSVPSGAGAVRVAAAAYLATSAANPSLAPTWTIPPTQLAGSSGATLLSFKPS